MLSRSLRGFEHRPQQVEMADAVTRALDDRRHLTVEAGTGVGKSFAYLIPAIQLVARKAGKVLVSTYTITLQEQLTNSDIPFLHDCLGIPFTSVLAKGRGNYLCKRRLRFALRRGVLLFDSFAAELARIHDWVGRTEDGSLSDLDFVPSGSVWDAVNSEHGNCRGRKCPHFQDCFYRRARRRAESADIIVANHALMFSDLVLKDQGASVLPNYRYVIIDEAQNIEHVAEEHLGINISNRTIEFLLARLYSPRTHKGLLAHLRAGTKAIDLIGRVDRHAKRFFRSVRDWYEHTKDQTNGRCYANFIEDSISGHLKDLRAELARLAKSAGDPDEKLEIVRFVDRCAELVAQFNSFFLQQNADHVYWVEASTAKRTTIRLRSAPVNVGPDVTRFLFDKYESVILTSATLSSGSSSDKAGIEFFAGRVGLKEFDALKLGSPFNYEKNVTLYIERDLPDPNEPEFIEVANPLRDSSDRKGFQERDKSAQFHISFEGIRTDGTSIFHTPR